MLVYKPPGILGTSVANQYKEKLNKKKVCICGKLDPMAEGQLLLLFDNDCKNMNKHLIHDKTYVFKILWGFSTDTDDTFGLINKIHNVNNYNINNNYINKYLKEFIGIYNQKFHKYSAKTVFNNNNEKHTLWKWSSLNRLEEIQIPEKKVIVDYIKILNTEKKKFNNIKTEIINIINKINTNNSNFRKDIILEQWIQLNINSVYITTFEAKVSSGYYIRQFINDFGNKSGLYGIALNINRTIIHI